MASAPLEAFLRAEAAAAPDSDESRFCARNALNDERPTPARAGSYVASLSAVPIDRKMWRAHHERYLVSNVGRRMSAMKADRRSTWPETFRTDDQLSALARADDTTVLARVETAEKVARVLTGGSG